MKIAKTDRQKKAICQPLLLIYRVIRTQKAPHVRKQFDTVKVGRVVAIPNQNLCCADVALRGHIKVKDSVYKQIRGARFNRVRNVLSDIDDNNDTGYSGHSSSNTAVKKGEFSSSSDDNVTLPLRQRLNLARETADGSRSNGSSSSDSDTENNCPKRRRSLRKTKSVASILTERRVSLNVTSSNCGLQKMGE